MPDWKRPPPTTLNLVRSRRWVSCHARWPGSCSSPCCSQTHQKFLWIHLKCSVWNCIDNFLTQPLFLASGGLLSGSVNILKVAMVPGATGAASRALLATDNSPTWTNDRARSERSLLIVLLVTTPPSQEHLVGMRIN